MTADTISDNQLSFTFGVTYFFVFLFLLKVFASGMKTGKVVKELGTVADDGFRRLRDDLSTRFSRQSAIRDLTNKIDTLQLSLNSSLMARVDALEQQMNLPGGRPS
jgi:hypothetical protein